MMLRDVIEKMTGKGLTSRLRAQAQRYHELNRFNGSVLVARGGEVLLREGFGMANVEHQAHNKPETVFRIGSISKALTSLMVMRLVEEGRIALADRIGALLPAWGKDDGVTVHHLLSNTSGIPDYIQLPAYQQIALRHSTHEQVIALFKDLPVQFAPGADFGYSNSNWVLLSALIERVTGQTYDQILHEWVLSPAGMEYSGMAWNQPIIPHRSTGYVDTGVGLIHADSLDETSMSGAGGIYSTVEDLYRLDRALAEERVLPRSALERLMQLVYGTEDEGYAYGWELHRVHGTHAVGHSGGLPGYSGDFLRLPEIDGVVIVLGNYGSSASNQLAADLAGLLVGVSVELPQARPFVVVDPAVLERYVGDYSSTFYGRTYILHFLMDGGRLAMDVEGLPRTYLSAYSDTEFYMRSKGDVALTFVTDASGQAQQIEMNWAGAIGTAHRV